MQTAAEARFGLQTILPVQFHPARATRPERRLALAVLEDAVAIYRTCADGPARNRRLIAETEQWLFSDDTGWPFSFVNVCHALGIDVGWLRARLERPTPATAAFDVLRPAAAAS